MKDALYDGEVFEAFKVTVSRAKKGARGAGGSVTAETKTCVDEIELLMETIRSQANGEDLTYGDSVVFLPADAVDDDNEQSIVVVTGAMHICTYIVSEAQRCFEFQKKSRKRNQLLL